MAVLNSELQEKIDALVDLAYEQSEGNEKESFRLLKAAWDLYPEPKQNWNEAYNTAKYIFEDYLKIGDLAEAQKWLHEMVKNNDTLGLSEGEVQYCEGKYYYETGNFEEAYKKFKYAVVDAKAGYRYFEDEDPKYLKLYKKPDTLIKPRV